MKYKTLTIGIPTYEAGESLVRTLTALYKAAKFLDVSKVLVAVDGKIISPHIQKRISNPKLQILNYKKREGQSARINSLIKNSTTDYLMLLNDDVLIEKNSLSNLFRVLNNERVDLISTRVKPLLQTNIVEKIISVGVEMNKYLSKAWNNYDNLLSCNGRMLILSKKFYEQVSIPSKIWNNDAYLFFACKSLSMSYKYLENVAVHYRSPQTFQEHFKQSSKFRFSKSENTRYFKNYTNHYRIPFRYKLITFTHSLKNRPLLTCLYSVLYLKSLTTPRKMPKLSYWDTDMTTKNI